MKRFLLFIFVLLITNIALAQLYPSSFKVAQDGTGDFKTIQEAVNAVRDFSPQQVKIYIKKGTYREKLVVPSSKNNIMLIGEEKEKTIITYDDYSGKNGINTFTSYTALIQGNDFIAENLTFQNSAGPVGQAVALHVEADRCIFRNCNILGNQDTLFPARDSSRQLYIDCYIEGTTDFIFGAATAVFKNCHIHSKKNSYVTAASTPQSQAYGFVFMNCTLTADSGITKVFLGRPWRPYAKTVFLNSKLGSHIAPEGWHTWNDNENHKTTYYAEYKSTGAGATLDFRVPWTNLLTKKQAKTYTLENIFNGKSYWNPAFQDKGN